MKNLLGSPNLWLVMVGLVTAFALLTYTGPQARITGLAVGTEAAETEEVSNVIVFSDAEVQPIVIETIEISPGASID